jgi:hypothetical protein
VVDRKVSHDFLAWMQLKTLKVSDGERNFKTNKKKAVTQRGSKLWGVHR